MARIQLVCPIDGSSLGAVNQNIAARVAGVSTVDPHVHLVVAPFDLTCGQGHRFRTTAEVDLTLERVA